MMMEFANFLAMNFNKVQMRIVLIGIMQMMMILVDAKLVQEFKRGGKGHAEEILSLQK